MQIAGRLRQPHRQGMVPGLPEWRLTSWSTSIQGWDSCLHMIIQIQAEGSGCPEWAMIELQGEVIKTEGSEASLDPGEPLPIGTLSQGSTVRPSCFDVAGQQILLLGASPQEFCNCGMQADSFHLTIGYHQLEGKRVPLKKPFAILETQHDSEHSGQHVMKASQSLQAATARTQH